MFTSESYLRNMTVTANNGAIIQAKSIWRVINATVVKEATAQNAFLQVPPNSAFCHQIVYNAGPTALQTFLDELAEVMANPPSSSLVQQYYSMAQHHAPVISPTAFHYWAYHRIMTNPYDSPRCNLQGGDSLFGFCPGNRKLKEYNDVVSASQSTVTQSVLGNRRGKLEEELKLVARCHTLDDIMHGLLHRAAASGLMVQTSHGGVPQYVYLIECMILQLNKRDVREQMRNDSSKERIRAHYLLNELEKILMAFTKHCTNYQVLSAATSTNLISSAPFEQALKRIGNIPTFVDALCQRELNSEGLVTLRLEKNPEMTARNTAASVPRRSANQVSIYQANFSHLHNHLEFNSSSHYKRITMITFFLL